jgi:tyrosine-protein phosphatase YwqE
VQESPDKIYNLVRSGVLSQITAMSFDSENLPPGAKVRRNSVETSSGRILLLPMRTSVDGRPPLLSKAIEAASRIVGREEAMAM